MSSSLEELSTRLEKLEKEIAELKKSKAEKAWEHEREIGQRMKGLLKHELGDQERIMAFIALEKRPGSPTGWDEWSIVGGMPGMGDIDIPKISKLMESCSNKTRLKILHELFKAPKYPKELTEITGLAGGALYHHLDVLKEAGLIRRQKIEGKKPKIGRIMRTPNGELFTDLVFNMVARIAHAIPKLEEPDVK